VLLETDAYVRDFLVRWGMNEPVSDRRSALRARPRSDRAQPGCEEYSVVARRGRGRADLHVVARRQLDRHEHRLSRADERQPLMIDPNKDVNEVCAFILAGKKNGCVILGGGSPKNFYLQGQPTLWEVYGIPKGGNDYFIQITTDRSCGAACPAPRRPRR
jgi:deoxyhypusine synthase